MDQIPPRNPSRMPMASRMLRQGQQALTIRTAQQSARPTAQHASPLSQQDQLKYPLAIPEEKLQKALKLYKGYRLAEKLANSRHEPPSATSNDGYHLSVPGPSTSQSVISFTSSRHQRQPSISDCDGGTDISSVVSFDGEEGSSSIKPKAQGELISFNGNKIRPHARKKLPPAAKAKAALIRYLGSCKVCRDRKVQCPIEHHDIRSLDNHLHLRDPPMSQTSQLSSSQSSSNSQATARSLSGRSQADPRVGSQSDALLGIGGNPALLQPDSPFDNGQLDIFSPGGAYEEPPIRFSAPMRFQPAAPLARIPEDPYSTFQNGMMFPIGSKRGYMFGCLFLGGCQALHHSEEELQTHFEVSHFCFTRIDPALRFVCASCLRFNETRSAFCAHCNMEGSIEVWIYGHYIRPDSHQRHGPDPSDLQTFVSPSITFSAGPWPASGLDQWGFDDNGDLTGGTQHPDYGYQGRSGSGGFGSHGFPDATYGGGADMNRDPSQGSSFTGNSYTTYKESLNNTRLLYREVKRYSFLMQAMFCVFLIMSLVPLGFTRNWVILKAEVVVQPIINGVRTHLPFVGFLAIVASFTTSFLLKLFLSRREQRDQAVRIIRMVEALASDGYQRQSVSAAMSDGHLVNFRCRQMVPEAYGLGGCWL